MRPAAVRAALTAAIEGVKADGKAHGRNTLRVVELGQRQAAAAHDRLVTVELSAGPSRVSAFYGWDLLEVVYAVAIHYAAGTGVEDRAAADMERLAVRLPAAVGGDLYHVEPGPSQTVEDEGQVRAMMDVTCRYRTDAAIVTNA